MSYIRKCSITVEGGAGTLDVSNLRCRFTIKQMVKAQPYQCTLKVTNLAPKTAAPFIKREYTKLTISAGYEDGPYGLIFSGDISQAAKGRETQTDTLLTVTAHSAGQAHTTAAVNVSLAAGSTPKDHLDAALKSMAPFGVTKGYVGPDLSTPKYPRAVSLYGMAHDIIERIAGSKQAVWWNHNGQMQMMKKQGDNLPGGVIKLNSQTGLIGMPTQEIGSIQARCLINPAITPGTQIQIDQASINQLIAPIDASTGLQDASTLAGAGNFADVTADGIYTVFEVDIDGDTRGANWYMDLHALAPGANSVAKDQFSKFPDPGETTVPTPSGAAPGSSGGIGHA